MKRRRTSDLLVEPPTSATGDIAFNLIVFFLVCASVQPDSGRKQAIPRSETKEQKSQTENIEVLLTRTSVAINGNHVRAPEFPQRIKSLLDAKARPQDKVVVVKSRPDTTYDHWIDITSAIEDAGGTITIQREEEREIVLPD